MSEHCLEIESDWQGMEGDPRIQKDSLVLLCRPRSLLDLLGDPVSDYWTGGVVRVGGESRKGTEGERMLGVYCYEHFGVCCYEHYIGRWPARDCVLVGERHLQGKNEKEVLSSAEEVQGKIQREVAQLVLAEQEFIRRGREYMEKHRQKPGWPVWKEYVFPEGDVRAATGVCCTPAAGAKKAEGKIPDSIVSPWQDEYGDPRIQKGSLVVLCEPRGTRSYPSAMVSRSGTAKVQGVFPARDIDGEVKVDRPERRILGIWWDSEDGKQSFSGTWTARDCILAEEKNMKAEDRYGDPKIQEGSLVVLGEQRSRLRRVSDKFQLVGHVAKVACVKQAVDISGQPSPALWHPEERILFVQPVGEPNLPPECWAARDCKAVGRRVRLTEEESEGRERPEKRFNCVVQAAEAARAIEGQEEESRPAEEERPQQDQKEEEPVGDIGGPNNLHDWCSRPCGSVSGENPWEWNKVEL